MKSRKAPSLGQSYRDRLVDVMAETLLFVLVTDHSHGAVLTQPTPLLEIFQSECLLGEHTEGHNTLLSEAKSFVVTKLSNLTCSMFNTSKLSSDGCYIAD